MKKIYILLLVLFAVTFSANAQLYVDARHSFMTNYVWRGYRLSDNTKPASFITNEEVFVGYAFTDIFTLEGGLYYYHEWSHRKFNDPRFWISAYIGDFKLTINDYMPMFGAGPHNGNYRFGEYFKGMGWEGALSYTFSPRLNYGELPLSITWNTVIYDPDDISATTGKQLHSTYLELDIPYTFPFGLTVKGAVGFVPFRSSAEYYDTEVLGKPVFTNLMAGLGYDIELGKGFSIPLGAQYVYNPYYKQSMWNVEAGIRFSFAQ